MLYSVFMYMEREVLFQKCSMTPAEKLRISGACFCCMMLKGESFT